MKAVNEIITFVCWLVCWMVGWLVGWLGGGWLGGLVSWLVRGLVGLLVGWLVGLFVGLFVYLFVCLFDLCVPYLTWTFPARCRKYINLQRSYAKWQLPHLLSVPHRTPYLLLNHWRLKLKEFREIFIRHFWCNKWTWIKFWRIIK